MDKQKLLYPALVCATGASVCGAPAKAQLAGLSCRQKRKLEKIFFLVLAPSENAIFPNFLQYFFEEGSSSEKFSKKVLFAPFPP